MSRLDSKTSDSNGDLVLTPPNPVNSSTEFIIRDTNSSSGAEVERVTVNPLSLTNIRLFGDDEVVKGDTLLLTAQLTSSTNVSDLSGYALEFSGAVTGTYKTDRNGQVTLYYTGQGTGSKTVTVTAGNWSTTKTFNDIIAHWDTPNSKYQEQYTYKQGFTKLSQYYSLDTSQGYMGIICIGDYNPVGNWELTFKVMSKITDAYFDIFTWSGNPVSLNNMDTSRLLSFNANDVIKARSINGTLTVTKNDTSLFTKSVNTNQYPGIMIMTQLTGVNINSNNAIPVKTLNFKDLKLMGV